MPSSKLTMLIACSATYAGLAGWAYPMDARPHPATGMAVAPDPAQGPVTPVAEAAPDVLLSAATTAVINHLKQDSGFRTRDPGKVAELLESTILPLFDFHQMTRLAMARDWRLATPAQQDALIAEFRTLLVRTYSTTLTNYRDQAIAFKPLQIAPGATDATVKSTMTQPGSKPLAIDYEMERTSAGWKVCDIRVAGNSLVTPYRSPFSQIIRDGGVDGLIDALAVRNRKAESLLKTKGSRAQPLLFMYTVLTNFFHGGK